MVDLFTELSWVSDKRKEEQAAEKKKKEKKEENVMSTLIQY